MRSPGPAGAAPLVPVLLFAALVVLLPAAVVFASSLEGSGGVAGLLSIFDDPLNRQALSNSLLQG
ncbi:MAG: hypothetical protein ACREC5_01315, partial [Thermoplasmata archaeon]